MNKYNTFLTLFIIAVLGTVVFFIFYINAIIGLAFNMEDYMEPSPNPIGVLATIFSPGVIISGAIAALASLAYRVQGIVLVARNKTVPDGEKALWIVGFILVGFVAAIVFLIMAKGRKFVA